MWTLLPLLLAGPLVLAADSLPPPPQETHDPLKALRPTVAAALVPGLHGLSGLGEGIVAADTLYHLGERHGRSDGLEAPIRNAALSGFGWSLVGGPLGGVVAVRRARSASLPIPPHRASSLQELGEVYREGYLHGFGEALRPRRREAALVGAMVGSVIWTFAIIRLVDLPGRSEFRGQLPGEEPTTSIIGVRIPAGRAPTVPG